MKLVLHPEIKTLMRQLTEDEFALLEQSVVREGVRDPLVVWRNGGKAVILDGHQRYHIIRRRGLPFKVHALRFKTLGEAKRWVILNQLGRRNLTPAEASYYRGMRYLQEKQAPHRPRKGDHNGHLSGKTRVKLAKEYGVGHGTIERDAEFAAGLSRLSRLAGSRVLKAALSKEAALTKKDVTLLAKKAEKDPDLARKAVELVLEGKAASGMEAVKHVLGSRQLALNRGAEARVEVKLGDFAELSGELGDGSVGLVLTDPPYGGDYLELWPLLAREARRLLRPGGFLVTLSGQRHLPTVINALSAELEYYWLAFLTFTSQRPRIWERKVWNWGKPILIYYKPPKPELSLWFQDLVGGRRPEKELHEWQQEVEPLAYLVKTFSNPEDLVLDPFLGTGSTLLACLEAGRRGLGFEKNPDLYAKAERRLNMYPPKK